MISHGTLPLPSRASIAIKLVVALFIENAVIVALLEGKPLAVYVAITFLNAFFEGIDGVRIHKSALALEGTLTYSRWTPAQILQSLTN